MGRYRSYYNTPTATFLTEADFIWVYAVASKAIAEIKNTKYKYGKELDGEIFTRMRGIYHIEKDRLNKESFLHNLFYGRKKCFGFKFGSLKQRDKERLFAMFEDLKRYHLKDTDTEEGSLYELENAIAAMKASIGSITTIAKDAEKVRRDIDDLEKFLEGSE